MTGSNHSGLSRVELIAYVLCLGVTVVAYLRPRVETRPVMLKPWPATD